MTGTPINDPLEEARRYVRRALVIGHSPTNEAPVLGSHRRSWRPSEGAGALVVADKKVYSVHLLE